MMVLMKKLRFICFALIPLLIVLCVGEVVARIATGDWSLRHELSGWLLVTDNDDAPTCHDPVTGWALRPGVTWRFDRGGVTYTIDDQGLRSNGQPRPAGSSVLALGDSFTFGCDVADADTWPAAMEREIGRPVLNGGVIGFGVDQAVLRGEQLVPRHRPDLVVLAFIDDDLDRCGWAARQALKPFYSIDDGALTLRQSPVPDVSAVSQIGVVRWSLGYSRLVALGMEFAPAARDRWYIGEYWRRAHDDGPAVAALLMPRLANLGAPVLVVALPSPDSKGRERGLLDAAGRAGLQTLDLTGSLDRMTFALGGHYDAGGNATIAAAVAKATLSAPDR